MSTDDRAPVGYDPVAPATAADPFPAYAELRDRCPVHRYDGYDHPMWSVARREDAKALLLDPSQWVNHLGAGIGYAGDEGRGNLQHFDRPEHTRRRAFLRDEFNPVRVVPLAEHTRQLAEQIVTAVRPLGRCELHDDVALPLPIIGFIEMLGVPLDDRDRIKAWADALVLGLSDPHIADQPTREIKAYIKEAVIERRAAAEAGQPVPDGLLSTYSLRPLEGELIPVRELQNMFLQLMVAGHETTTSLITNMVWRLLEDREQRWERVRADRSLIEVAVEESLRFDPPVLGLFRTNVEPTTLGGHELPADSKVMVLYASANRDPATFPEPDVFSLDRDAVQLRHHMAFGWGVHFCLGAPLARQTARIALDVLLDELPTLRLDGTTERIAPAFLWGRRRLPVAWD